MSPTNEPPPPPRPPQPAHEGGWRPTKKQIIAAVIGIVALVAILQNTRKGHFNFLFFDFEAAVWIWLVVNFGAGVVAGLLIASQRAKKRATQT
jgi:uncharacterized integral membrane protein